MATDYPKDKCIHQLFEEQAERAPDALAVVFEGRSLTYRELNQRADQLAHHLRTLGVGPDVLAGVCMERSLEIVVAFLAVLKAGGAIVPIDPILPAERLAFIMADTQTPVILTQSSLLGRLPPTEALKVCVDLMPDANADATPEAKVSPQNLAYVIYTSGSTGRPKGVLITQAAYLNYCAAAIDYFGLTATDRVLQFATLSFDAGIDQLLTPLLAGATVVMRGVEIWNPALFTDVIRDLRVTTIHLTPIYWHEWLEVLSRKPCGESIGALRMVQVGGDVMPVSAVRSWCALGLCSVRLINRYGPTETTMFTTAYEVPCQSPNMGNLERVPIGRPVGSRTIHVLDAQRKPVQAGLTGEIYIGGSTLALGYLNQPELTAGKFTPDPFSSQSGARLYRTGDLARVLPDGNIEFLGRADFQVKIRGYRIELGEIEAVLGRHPAVREAVAIVREDRPGDRHLVAYVVSKTGATLTSDELRNHAKTSLPNYMMPSVFVSMEKLPQTPNGKVDRKALEKMGEARMDTGKSHVAPNTDFERQLAAVWQEVLDVPKIGIHDNFFEMGGHSLLAMRAIMRMDQIFDAKLTLREFFENPTVAAQSAKLKVAAAQSIPPLQPVSRDGPLHLSFAQERLWFLSEYEPGCTAYNLPRACRLTGQLDAEILERALGEIVRRHEVLRTTFHRQNGEVVQVIVPVADFKLPVVELSGLPREQHEAEARRIITNNLQTPFDLAVGPLIWAKLFRLDSQEHILLVNMHHIISDGWSLGVFDRELSVFYTAFRSGQPASIPPLAVQYADYAAWRRQWIEGDELEKRSKYWREQLAGAPALELPTDHPRPPQQTYSGTRLPLIFPDGLAATIAAFNQKSGVTPFMSLLAAFQVLLSRYARQEDILVGTPIATRQRVELEDLIGFFVNMQAMRGNLSGNPSFLELVGQVRQTSLEALDLPFEELVKALNPVRDPSRHPLFQVVFALQNTPEHPLTLADLTSVDYPLPGTTTHFDLELHLWQCGNSWEGHFVYNTDLFEKTTIDRMAQHYLTLLENLLAQPERPVSQAPMLTVTEQHQLVVEWNATTTDFPKDKCVHQLFDVQAEKTPEAMAMKFEGESLTYSELNQRANQLAHHLRGLLGVGPDVPVGICMRPSLDLVVGMLAVLKAGGAYLPLDAENPMDRLAFMLEDAQAPVLLTRRDLLARMPRQSGMVICLDADWKVIGHASRQTPANTSSPKSLACIIYTSGSTGKPKGVAVPHRAISRLVLNTNYIRLGQNDRLAQVSNVSFDAATFEIWGALLNGCQLIGITREVMLSPKNFARELRDQGITVMFLTTAFFNQVAREAPDAFANLRIVMTGGEALDPSWVRTVLEHQPPQRLLNVYGPTENTTFTTSHDIQHLNSNATHVPIGRPIANTQVYILDPHLNPVPIGVAGELFTGGDGLARSYWNRPELTAARFVKNPFQNNPDKKIYRTGDLCRWLPDGSIEFLGRSDDQVKIRGFRVEPGEIEAALRRHPDLEQAAVLTRFATDGLKQIAAWIVVRKGREVVLSKLRQELGQWLPDYIIPGAFTLVESLPLNANGKVDRRALSKMTGRDLATDKTCEAPHTDVERQMAAIWQAALNVPEVGIHDNFFDLGGHSLLAMRLITEIQKHFNSDVSLASLFEAPTVAEFAPLLEKRRGARVPAPSPRLRGKGDGAPLFFIPGIAGYEFLPEAIAHRVGATGRFYDGLQYPGLNGREQIPSRFEDLAASLIPQIQRVWPDGPYLLCGYSLGGVVAFEVARQLKARGLMVPLVLLLDSSNPAAQPRRLTFEETVRRIGNRLSGMEAKTCALFFKDLVADKINFLWKRKQATPILLAGGGPMVETLIHAHDRYRPGTYDGKVALFQVEEKAFRGFRHESDPLNGWRDVAQGGLEIIRVQGNHVNFLKEPFVFNLAEKVQSCLENAVKTSSQPGTKGNI